VALLVQTSSCYAFRKYGASDAPHAANPAGLVSGVHRRTPGDLRRASGRGLGARPGTLSAVAGSLIAAGLVLAVLFEGWLPGRLGRLTSSGERFALSACILVLGAALDLLLRAYATHLHWTRAKPPEWVGHATLNAIGVAVILHVAIGRRWPFGGQRSREAA
jgi:hypothetical protein